MSATIPASFYSEENLDQLKRSFDNAKPYRHLAIENFLEPSLAKTLFDRFPARDVLSKHYKGLNENKSEGSDFAAFDPGFQQVRDALSSKEFIAALEKITGITGLFTTDDPMGSGVHQGVNGSYLDVHIDFNIHHIKDLHRRLNVLVFLNEEWLDTYGGKLELWNHNVTELGQEILPLLNRCVIFETSEISYHGYSKITVPETITRNSFYAYYYTPIGDYKEKYHDTVFKARPSEGLTKKIKTDVKETLKNNVKRTLKRLGIKY